MFVHPKDSVSLEQLSDEGYCTIPPDLAVEVVSPNDLVAELDEKVEEYLRAGVKLVWVVHPDARARPGLPSDGRRAGSGTTNSRARTSSRDSAAGSTDFFPKEAEAPRETGATAPNPIKLDVGWPRSSARFRQFPWVTCHAGIRRDNRGPPAPRSGEAPSFPVDSFVPEHRVIERDESQLVTETRGLLQQRLRAASLVLVVGFGLFFIRSLCLHDPESLTVMFHGLLLSMLILSLSLLSSSWRPTLRAAPDLRGALFAT